MKRVQRQRSKGFRLPPKTVCVDRSTKLGNPFDWRDYVEDAGSEREAKAAAVALLRAAINCPARFPGKTIPTRHRIRMALYGKDFVACWCKLSDPCHGDLYIEIARQDEPTIADLIARKRAAGPDRGFETLLASPWVCPHCHFRGTILSALIDVAHPGSDMACPECKTPGFGPIAIEEVLR